MIPAEQNALLGRRNELVREINAIDEKLNAPEVTDVSVGVERTRAYLEERRRQIVQRRDWRHREFEQQREAEIKRCGFKDERHIEIHLRNVFGSGERMRQRLDAQDQLELDAIDQRLGQLGSAA